MNALVNSFVPIVILLNLPALFGQELAKIAINPELIPNGTRINFTEKASGVSIKTSVQSDVSFTISLSKCDGVLTNTEQIGMGVLAIHHPRRMQLVDTQLPSGKLLPVVPRSVLISVEPIDKDANGNQRVRVGVHMKGQGTTRIMTSESKGEVWRIEKGNLILEDEGWWHKIRI